MTQTLQGRPAEGILAPSAIRAEFPALEREHAGHRVAYFDGPGGTQVPRRVVDAMADYLVHHNANTHWAYPSSAETDRILDASRAALAEFLGASADEIAFGPSMTTLTFHVARALGRGWSEGDEVIVTELDHHANIAPWTALERERGVRVHRAKLDPAMGQLDWDDLERCVTPRTRLLAVGGASNALGTINDVGRVVALARRAGALSFIDAVHWAPHARIRAHDLGCDFLACSPYKFYGPHLGVMYARRAVLAALDVPRLEPASNRGGERLETGTQNHEGIAGAAAAVDFLADLADGASRTSRLDRVADALHQRGAALLVRLWEGLAGIDGVTLYGPAPDRPRTPTVAFTVRGVTSTEVARRLAARHAVFVSHGDFYAATVVRRLGLGEEGLVRAGCACYTTVEEVDRLLAGVREIAAGH
jgi:cysteine desulfurase family protein (TIGR01976 family)